MESPQAVLHLLFGLVILLGLASCFAGYRIYRFILAVPGWLVGAALLGSLAYLVSDNWFLAIVAGLIGGSIGAWVVLAWWTVQIFRVGFGFGLLLDVALWLLTDGQVEPVVLIAIPIVAGIMAYLFERWTLIVITAFVGAAFVLIGGAWFAVGADDLGVFLAADGGPLKALLAGWLLLGLIGVSGQYAGLRGWRNEAEPALDPDHGAGIGTPAGRVVATAVSPPPLLPIQRAAGSCLQGVMDTSTSGMRRTSDACTHWRGVTNTGSVPSLCLGMADGWRLLITIIIGYNCGTRQPAHTCVTRRRSDHSGRSLRFTQETSGMPLPAISVTRHSCACLIHRRPRSFAGFA